MAPEARPAILPPLSLAGRVLFLIYRKVQPMRPALIISAAIILMLTAATTLPAIASDNQQALTPAKLKSLYFDAAREGRTDILDALIAAGAPVDARDRKGYTAFILATYNGHQDAASVLLARGADPCVGDKRGNTAQMGLAFKGNTAMSRWLIAATDCAIDQQNHAGQTALMMAALFDREEMVEELLAAGADPALTDAAGNTAATLAEGQGLGKMLSVLRFHSETIRAKPRQAG